MKRFFLHTLSMETPGRWLRGSSLVGKYTDILSVQRVGLSQDMSVDFPEIHDVNIGCRFL